MLRLHVEFDLRMHGGEEGREEKELETVCGGKN